WAFDYVRDLLMSEISILTRPNLGLNFNAKRASLDFLEGSFMKEAADIISKNAPLTWKMVHALLDTRLNDKDVDMSGDTEARDEEVQKSRHLHQGQTRKTALLMIVCTTCHLRHYASVLTPAQKTVFIISIVLHSTNQRCNYFQAIFGIFLHSFSVPEKVIEALSHAGVSVALSSIHNAVNTLSVKASHRLKAAVQGLTTMFTYDNFDIKFKAWEPTLEHTSSFVSATSATAIPIYGVGDQNRHILRCSSALWEKSPLNPSPAADQMRLLFSTDEFVLLKGLIGKDTKTPERPGDLTPQQKRWAWHIRQILVKNNESFRSSTSNMGEPEKILPIPLHRTEQIPCRAMKFKESTTDGNIQVVNDLHRQGGI
ncbi:hypothetical protein K435DRAFT_561231, partial [Dendrothele bispora CBS 962.96]